MVMQRLAEVDLQMASLFDDRFSHFAEPLSPADAARLICEHHETIQKRKSSDGKRACTVIVKSARLEV